MKLRKTFAIAVSAVVLTAQLWAILPPGDASWKSWYWPFMDYPMYAQAHYPGDVFARHRLTGIRCEADDGEDAEEEIRHRHLRLERFYFAEQLQRIASPSSADPMLREHFVPHHDAGKRLVTHLIRTQSSGRYCGGRVWEQAVVLGEPLPEDLAILWKLMHEWEIGEADEGEDPLASTQRSKAP